MEEIFKEINDVVTSYLLDALRNPAAIEIQNGEFKNQFVIKFEYAFRQGLFNEAIGDLNHAFTSRDWQYEYLPNDINNLTTILITV